MKTARTHRYTQIAPQSLGEDWVGWKEITELEQLI